MKSKTAWHAEPWAEAIQRTSDWSSQERERTWSLCRLNPFWFRNVCVCVFSLSRYQGPLASYKTLEKKLYCIGPEKEHQLPKITSSLQARIAAAWDLWTQKFHSGCSANSFQPARNKLSLPSFLAWSSSAFYKFTVFCPTLWIKSLNHNILKMYGCTGGRV